MDIRNTKNEGNLELYVHIPFCVKKCDYCDFLSSAASNKTQLLYIDALKAEILQAAKKYKNRHISTVFFGGGTPSILDGAYISEIMALLKSSFSFHENAEITIEANPGTLSLEKLMQYQTCGINRLSIGCQSIHEKELKRLGRIHTFEEFKEGFSLAREVGFRNINVDLMSGLPGQNLQMWEQSLRTIAEMGAEHISAYSLIIEEGTPFYGQSLNLPDEDLEREMYHKTEEILREYGFEAYEISNYAKPGYECCHNLGYWIRENYLGLGLGASSLVDEVRFSNERDLEKYIDARGSLDLLHQNKEYIEQQEQMEETMILGLRLRKGVSMKRFQQNFGINLVDYYAEPIQKYQKLKMLEIKDDYLRLTKAGIDVSNWILADFA